MPTKKVSIPGFKEDIQNFVNESVNEAVPPAIRDTLTNSPDALTVEEQQKVQDWLGVKGVFVATSATTWGELDQAYSDGKLLLAKDGAIIYQLATYAPNGQVKDDGSKYMYFRFTSYNQADNSMFTLTIEETTKKWYTGRTVLAKKDDNIFVATYGETTYGELLDVCDKQKIIYLLYGDHRAYLVNLGNDGNNSFAFIGINHTIVSTVNDPDYITFTKYRLSNNDKWSRDSEVLATRRDVYNLDNDLQGQIDILCSNASNYAKSENLPHYEGGRDVPVSGKWYLKENTVIDCRGNEKNCLNIVLKKLDGTDIATISGVRYAHLICTRSPSGDGAFNVMGLCQKDVTINFADAIESFTYQGSTQSYIENTSATYGADLYYDVRSY